MRKSHLRWWLWTATTIAVLVIAGIFGFYGLLLRSDITYLGIGVVGLYLASTLWIGIKLKSGNSDFAMLHYIAEQMQYVGLLGTFIGLAVAFQSLASVAIDSPEFKTALMHGVLTKLYTSIVGIVGAMFLRTQLAMLETRE